MERGAWRQPKRESGRHGDVCGGNVDLRYPSSLSLSSLICTRDISLFVIMLSHIFFVFAISFGLFQGAHDSSGCQLHFPRVAVLLPYHVHEELRWIFCAFWYIFIMCARWNGLPDEARLKRWQEDGTCITTHWLMAAVFVCTFTFLSRFKSRKTSRC